MTKSLRITIISIICVFALCTMSSCHRHAAGPYNPYLKMKTKPSQEQKKKDAKIIKKGNKAYKKQLGDSRKQIFGRRRPPKAN